jgi:hypothetical protein
MEVANDLDLTIPNSISIKRVNVNISAQTYKIYYPIRLPVCFPVSEVSVPTTTVPPPPQCHHMSLMDFVVSPPGCGRSVTDF